MLSSARTMASALASLFALGVLTTAGPVFAKGDAAAEALYVAGREAATKGDWAKACASFDASFRIEAAPGTALNLGDCEEHLGHLASAWELFARARDAFETSDTRRAYAVQRMAALEPNVPKLELRAASGVVVLRDGAELPPGALGVALPIDPGLHRIVARSPGHVDVHREVELHVGEVKTLELEAGPPNASPARAGQSSTTSNAPTSNDGGVAARKTMGVVLGGVGVVGLATGVVTGILVLDRASTYRAHCNDANVCDPDGLSAARQGKTLEILSPVALGIGAAAVIAGAVLYFAPGPRRDAALMVAPGFVRGTW